MSWGTLWVFDLNLICVKLLSEYCSWIWQYPIPEYFSQSLHIFEKTFAIQTWAMTCLYQQNECTEQRIRYQSGYPPTLIRVSAVCSVLAKNHSFLHADRLREYSDQTELIPSPIAVFSWRIATVLVFICRSSNAQMMIWPKIYVHRPLC